MSGRVESSGSSNPEPVATSVSHMTGLDAFTQGGPRAQ